MEINVGEGLTKCQLLAYLKRGTWNICIQCVPVKEMCKT